MPQVDVKYKVWKRYQMEDKEFEKFMQLDEKEKHNSIFDYIDCDTFADYLFETEEQMDPKENSNNPTIEVYGKKYDVSRHGRPFNTFGVLWDNTPLDIKRQKKIEQIKI